LKRYRQLEDIVRFAQPKTIVEVGAHRGERAEMLCREALKYRSEVHYKGYDLFEEATDETNAAEMNGKRPATVAALHERLSKIDGVTFELVKGNTRETLHAYDVAADLVFIDGGHSVETIRGDYEALKGSNVIVFDDYYAYGVDTEKFGCNKVLEGVEHEVLERIDATKGMGIKLAVVGYSSKWAPAFDNIRKKDSIKSIAIWRPGFDRDVDMIAVLNHLETLVDPEETLEKIRGHCKRLFFAIRADGLRSLPWWRAQLEKKFQVHEWFGNVNEYDGPTTEVCGTASRLLIIGELQARGVMDESERDTHVRANVAKVPKRLVHTPMDQHHDRKAIIVCYGPSLQDTWSDLVGQLKIEGGDVFSVSGAHDFLLRREIVPKYHVECDPRPHKAENLTRPQEGIEYLIASCCHPDLVDKLLPYDLTLWHMHNGAESVAVVEELEPDAFMVHGGGNAGLRAIAVAYVLGYRDFVIYGMDYSFKSNGQQWAGKHVGKKKDEMEVVCDGEKFLTSSVNVSYCRHFIMTVDNAPGATFKLVGHGLLQAMMAASNKQYLKENAA
jgi:uncharacterized Rossmann fold enzyme